MSAPASGMPVPPRRLSGRGAPRILSTSTTFYAFLAVYGIIGVELYVAAIGFPEVLPMGFLVLTASLVLLVLGGIFDEDPTRRRFYLAAAVLLLFTYVRLVFVGALAPIPEILLSYLILGGSLVLYQTATRVRVRVGSLQPGTLRRTLPLAIPLGLGFAILDVILPFQTRDYLGEVSWLAVGVASTVAFLDEYWFRGVLQAQMVAVSTPLEGGLGTALLFAVFAAPMGDPFLITYRAGLGLVLGYLVWRHRLLSLALATRVVAAVLAILLGDLLLWVGLVP